MCNMQKPNSLVQLIAICIGMQSMYAGASYLIGNLYIWFSAIFMNNAPTGGYTALYLVAALLSLLLGYIVVFRSYGISGWITRIASFQHDLPVVIRPSDLLCLLLIFIAVGHLLTSLPSFISHMINLVPTRRERLIPEGRVNWVTSITDIALPVLLLLYCRPLAQLLTTRTDVDSEAVIPAGTRETSEPDEAPHSDQAR